MPDAPVRTVSRSHAGLDRADERVELLAEPVSSIV
jgi:hypothetical protein